MPARGPPTCSSTSAPTREEHAVTTEFPAETTTPARTKPLSPAELREALRLVAGELDALGAHSGDPLRWGQLQAHLEGLADPGRAPYALAVLRRRGARSQAAAG